MNVLVNGKKVETQSPTIAELLNELGAPRYVAVELNCEVVPRAKHSDTVLHDGDQIELVTLVGGG